MMLYARYIAVYRLFEVQLLWKYSQKLYLTKTIGGFMAKGKDTQKKTDKKKSEKTLKEKRKEKKEKKIKKGKT